MNTLGQQGKTCVSTVWSQVSLQNKASLKPPKGIDEEQKKAIARK